LPFSIAPVPTSPLRFGADILLSTPARWTEWQHVALVTNDAARLATAVASRTRHALRQAGLSLVLLFGPEHGLGASADDGASVADGIDPLTGLPVISLYGERLRPAREQLAGLDVVLFDIPDVGARFYTYAWTLWHVLHACADADVPLVVLDRPNPLGGVLDAAEGPLLAPDCRSFIGEDDIPVRHSLTLGELARLWQREHCAHARLDVIACEGWATTRAWPSTGLPWVPTSPAMPSFDSAMWYPGTCLFEATNVSVGRGTEWPFATIGAPWMDAHAMAHEVQTDGVRLSPVTFTPMQGPHAGIHCHGVRLSLVHPSDHCTTAATFVARTLRPVTLGLQLLHAVCRLHPHEFAWAPYPTAANPTGQNHLARLVGRSDVAERLVTLLETQRVSTITEWTRVADWPARTAPILLYDRTA
jgi:uncharacterized protein YbbC (DUF1343 family)